MISRSKSRPVQGIEWLEQRIAPATFIVTSVADSGAGTLRQAILDANGSANTGGIGDVIEFQLTGGQFIIRPLSPLPAIIEAVTIDGYTQDGASENDDDLGSNATILVGLDGSLTTGNGLVLGGTGGSVVRGLAIFGFGPGINDSGYGIKIISSNNQVAGNFIGLDPAGNGTTATSNKNAGVVVGDFFGPGGTFSDNLIGGTDLADRNVLSNNAFGVLVTDDGSNTLIRGNLIGTDITGFDPMPNFQSGIADAGSNHLVVGDGTAAGRNVISGNNTVGIGLGGSKDPVILDNYIGTNAQGSSDLANGQSGIRADNGARDGFIKGNVISGNGGDGIELGSRVGDGSASGFDVVNNIIGRNAAFNESVPNQGAGVGFYSGAAHNTIGGIAPSDGNRIAQNFGAGILDLGSSTNSFFGNVIFQNGSLDIDQRSSDENVFGVSPNDNPDADGITNAPVLTTFANDGLQVTIGGIIIGKPNTLYRVEFFAAAPNQVDISGFGGAGAYLGFVMVTTNGNGVVSVNFNQPVSVPTDSIFNATATPDAAGGTSEFGKAIGPSTTYTWNGESGNGDWFDAGNWAPAGVPGPLDSVVLPATGSPIDLLGDVSVQSFQQSGGTLQGSGRLFVLNSWTWTGGSHDGVGTLALVDDATGTIGGANANWIDGALEIRGSLTIATAGVSFDTGAFNISAAGSVNFGGNFVDPDDSNSPVVATNFGFIFANSTGTRGLVGIALENHGTIDVFGGTFTADAILNLGGNLILAGGNFAFPNGLELLGGNLEGSGTVTGNVTVDGGTISPGGIGTAGRLTIQGTLLFDAGILKIDLNGTTAATQYDQVVVTGDASVNGNLEYAIGSNFVVRAGNNFTILTANSVDGSFESISGELTINTIDYQAAAIVLGAKGFLVTNTNDSGPGSLRQAILDANGEDGTDLITFNIPGAGLHVIAPLTLLPELTDSTIIDGYSQPGASLNSLAIGSNAALRIQLSGSNIASGGVGLLLEASNNMIGGLIFSGWTSAALRIESSSNFVVGNWIGTDSAGTAGSGQLDGIVLVGPGTENRIGAAEPRFRNVLSGNERYGIQASNQADLIIQNNYLGVTPSGTTALGNGNHAIFLTSSSDIVIGGSEAGQGNLISASKNSSAGVALVNTVRGIVAGNLIGTDATGLVAFGNASYGILAQNTSDLQIGGGADFESNVISGNLAAGILLNDSVRASIYGNLIGIASNGTSDLPNGVGISLLRSSDSIIGNPSPGFGNRIAFNNSHGISIDTASGISNGNSIRGNSIFLNGLLGIDLVVAGEPNFITQNDAGDGDDGPNRLINFPTLLSFERGAQTKINGIYNGAPNSSFFIDFYVSTTADPNGAGEGQLYLGSAFVTTDANGLASFSAPVDDFSGGFLSATATSSLTSDTSEFGFILPASLTYIWDGEAGGDTSWFNPLNWDRNTGFPSIGDTAILNIDAVITLSDQDVTVANYFHSLGTLTGSAKLSVANFLSWDSGEMSGSGSTVVLAGGSGMLTGPGTKTLTNRTLHNQGTMNWFEAGHILLDGAILDNEGTFQFANDSVIEDEQPSQIFNSGLMTKAIGAGVSLVSDGIAFHNSGRLFLTTGTLQIDGSFTQIDGFTQVVGATLRSPNLTFSGGLLEGNGTVDGSVLNTGAEVLPGFAGVEAVLRITGDYTQTADGQLTIYFGNGLFSLLIVEGDASLDGTLRVDDVAVVPPLTPGSLFEILTADSVTGTFDTTDLFLPFTLQYGAEDVNLVAPGGGGGDTLTVDARNPLNFLDANGEEVKITLQGAGSIIVSLIGGLTDNADIASMLLLNTDLTTKIKVVMGRKTALGTSVLQLSTSGAEQHVGTITFGDRVTLGDGNDDDVADFRVTGKLKALVLDDIVPHTLIQLGEGLPYNVLQDTTTPDSLNNRPDLTVGDILGPDVQINILNNGLPGSNPASRGGGGFGNVVIHSWEFDGFLRTTQSIGNFTVLHEDFYGVLKVDALSQGEGTEADMGAMTIADGAWGSSGTEIEGDVKSFNAQAFLEGASIEAKTIGSIKMTEGAFEGTLILTSEDVDSPALGTFTVDTNFTGRVISTQSIKKLVIKGDFTGSLEAPSIGSITAFAFLGTAGETEIRATQGALGALKTTAGVVRDYDLITPLGFSGITVKLAKITESVAGISNVRVTAASIGNLSVSLTAAKGSNGVSLTGIANSIFTTTAAGTTKGNIGTIGNITVALAGGAGGNGLGIVESTFDARIASAGTEGASTLNSLGKIGVKVKGFGGMSVGMDTVIFEGDTIGTTKVSVTKGVSILDSRGILDVQYLSKGAIGALTFDGDVSINQVTNLQVTAGGKVGALTVKAKNAAMGNLVESTILAGQALQTTGSPKAQLTNASLGAVSLTGELRDSTLGAGASIGAVKVQSMMNSQMLAGVRLGSDRILGGENDTFHGAATIASIVTKGAIQRTSVIAGVDPVNGIYGDLDDIAATGGTGTIGAITLGGNSGPLNGAVDFVHQFVIQAAALKSLKTTAGKITTFAADQFLDTSNPGQDAADILIRLV